MGRWWCIKNIPVREKKRKHSLMMSQLFNFILSFTQRAAATRTYLFFLLQIHFMIEEKGNSNTQWLLLIYYSKDKERCAFVIINLLKYTGVYAVNVKKSRALLLMIWFWLIDDDVVAVFWLAWRLGWPEPMTFWEILYKHFIQKITGKKKIVIVIQLLVNILL